MVGSGESVTDNEKIDIFEGFKVSRRVEAHNTNRASVSYEDLLYEAWCLIANAGGGNWENESYVWREAARRWRDRWHGTLTSEGNSNG